MGHGTKWDSRNFAKFLSSDVWVPGLLLVIKEGYDPEEGNGDFSSMALAASGRESAPAGFWLGMQSGGKGEEKERGLRES